MATFMVGFHFLQVHGEVTDPHVDTFDREKVFIERILAPLVQRLPQLKIVMEHITTMDAVNFVESCKEGLCHYSDLNISVCPCIWSLHLFFWSQVMLLQRLLRSISFSTGMPCFRVVCSPTIIACQY
jgi:dihydroorotase